MILHRLVMDVNDARASVRWHTDGDVSGLELAKLVRMHAVRLDLPDRSLLRVPGLEVELVGELGARKGPERFREVIGILALNFVTNERSCAKHRLSQVERLRDELGRDNDGHESFSRLPQQISKLVRFA